MQEKGGKEEAKKNKSILKCLLHSSFRLRFCKDLFRFLAVVTARMFP